MVSDHVCADAELAPNRRAKAKVARDSLVNSFILCVYILNMLLSKLYRSIWRYIIIKTQNMQKNTIFLWCFLDSVVGTGDDLLSPQGVSSVLPSFTSLFGMGRGVSQVANHQIQLLNELQRFSKENRQ